ncbi:MAG: UDP-N-acetylmuramoyl-tripeptide--D-alanyl-D-alanine ligase, partial [Lachnospiraceae bacterium]|nr:UDP-N-acetylmuramoyl-tripeptide--D-alanyl-D-alanine ligase [Lachnospiraceae bacterium]
MRNLTVENIVKAVEGTLIGNINDPGMTVSEVCMDSRKVVPGCLFIAVKGERVDSHKFIPEVVKNGAAAVIGEVDTSCDVPYIKVESGFTALEKLAGFYRSGMELPIVAITGSVGKTSTKEAVAAVLSAKYNVLKTAGNLNNNIGLPQTVLSIRDEHSAAVVEMGISHFDEMERMSLSAKPDIAVITNIGVSHIEYLGSREGILKEKSHIFDHLKKDGIAVVNGDDDLLSKLDESRVFSHRIYKYGMKEDALDAKAVNVKNHGLKGSDFDVRIIRDGKEKTIKSLHTPLPGDHMVMNGVCAALIGDLLGLNEDEIIKGLRENKGMAGRSNIINTDKYTIIDDCYNANPASTEAALELLKLADTRKVAILGDMYELGEGERQMHAE